jgi:hypothetical protein
VCENTRIKLIEKIYNEAFGSKQSSIAPQILPKMDSTSPIPLILEVLP